MAKVNVEVGANLASGFQGTLKSASGAVSGMAVDMKGPLQDIASGATATQASLNLLRDFLMTRFLGPLGSLVVGLGGVSAAMWLLNKASGAAAQGLQQFSTIEDLEGQFRPLLGSISATKARLAELADFAAKTPFELPEVAAASKTLEVLTRGALATGQGLTIVGGLAAQSGQPFQELAMWVGRLYDGLQSGRPVGEAMARLQELGLVSGTTRSKIEELQKAGKAGNEVWQVMVSEFSRASGSMDVLSQSITGMRSTLEDARKALYREMGKSFAEQEKEAILGATEVTEKFTPIAAEMMKTLSGAGMASTPGQWIPVFDKELKQFLSTVLSFRGEVVGLGKSLLFMGQALALATIVGAVVAIKNFVTWLSRSTVEARAFVQTQSQSNKQWQWSIANIKANTVALTENMQAAGRSRAVMMAQAAAVTVARTATNYFTASLKAMGAAFYNPVTIVLTAVTAMWQWINSMEEAHKRAMELNDAYGETARSTAQQIKDIKTLSEKAAFLVAQYEALKKAQKDLGVTVNDEERQNLERTVKLIQLRIREAEALNNSELAAGSERQRLIDEIKKTEEDYAKSKLTDAEKLIAKEKEILAMQEKRVALAKAVEAAEKAASAASNTDIDKQIAAQQKIIAGANAKSQGFTGRTAARDAARVAAEQAPVISAASAKIEELRASKEGRTAAFEGASTALQAQDNEISTANIEADKLRISAEAAEKKAQARAAELYTEAQILALQTTGSQRVADELALRQQLLAVKIKEAEAEGRSLDAAELKNQYTENEKKLLDTDKQRNAAVSGERKQRMEAREERRIAQLPKLEQVAELQQKQNDLNAKAEELEKRAASAREAGNDPAADDLELRAEKARARADRYGASAEDIAKGPATTPQVSSLARIGGAAGEASGATADYAKSTFEETKKLRASTDAVKNEISSLRQDMRKPPEFDDERDY